MNCCVLQTLLFKITDIISCSTLAVDQQHMPRSLVFLSFGLHPFSSLRGPFCMPVRKFGYHSQHTALTFTRNCPVPLPTDARRLHERPPGFRFPNVDQSIYTTHCGVNNSHTLGHGLGVARDLGVHFNWPPNLGRLEERPFGLEQCRCLRLVIDERKVTRAYDAILVGNSSILRHALHMLGLRRRCLVGIFEDWQGYREYNPIQGPPKRGRGSREGVCSEVFIFANPKFRPVLTLSKALLPRTSHRAIRALLALPC